MKGLEAIPQKIGGVADHLHMLVGCKTTHRPCDLVREIKKSATSWVHEDIGYEPFAWQEGYSVFSVSPGACDGVANYIARQRQHHHQKTFQEELEEVLRKAGIEFDPKYLQ